jgi:hypothetical protein
LHDLQPYVCTYRDCPKPSALYRSRAAWVDHESSVHRQIWRCYEHPDKIYPSPENLRAHLQQQHGDRLTEPQMTAMISFSGVKLPDDRSTCPICLEDGPFPMGLENHLASHLERIASFALPRGGSGAEGEEGASNAPQQAGENSQNLDESLSELTFEDRGASNGAASDEGALALATKVSAILSASYKLMQEITTFVATYTESHHELLDSYSKLSSLRTILERLTWDAVTVENTVFPNVMQYHGVLDECVDIIDNLSGILEGYAQERGGALRWVVYGKPRVLKINIILEFHCRRLDLALNPPAGQDAEKANEDAGEGTPPEPEGAKSARFP